MKLSPHYMQTVAVALVRGSVAALLFTHIIYATIAATHPCKSTGARSHRSRKHPASKLFDMIPQ